MSLIVMKQNYLNYSHGNASNYLKRANICGRITFALLTKIDRTPYKVMHRTRRKEFVRRIILRFTKRQSQWDRRI